MYNITTKERLMKKQYYSININGLKVRNLEPLEFEHTIIKKDVPFYQAGILGRLITVEGNNPTNTLEEAEAWLTDIAKKRPDLEFLQRETVPYINMETIAPLATEEIKKLRKERTTKKFNFLSK